MKKYREARLQAAAERDEALRTNPAALRDRFDVATLSAMNLEELKAIASGAGVPIRRLWEMIAEWTKPETSGGEEDAPC